MSGWRRWHLWVEKILAFLWLYWWCLTLPARLSAPECVCRTKDKSHVAPGQLCVVENKHSSSFFVHMNPILSSFLRVSLTYKGKWIKREEGIIHNRSDTSLCVLHNFLCGVWEQPAKVGLLPPGRFVASFNHRSLSGTELLLTTGVRDHVCERAMERLCHRFFFSLAVYRWLCSPAARTISINAGKWRGGGGEKDGHESWQRPLLFCCSSSASLLDIVIQWAACSSAPVSPASVREAHTQYLLKWGRGDGDGLTFGRDFRDYSSWTRKCWQIKHH